MNSSRAMAFLAMITALAVAGAASGIDMTSDSFCSLTSSREGSRVTVEIRDGGYSYERLEGIVGSNEKSNWSVTVNGVIQKTGELDPANGSSWSVFRVNMPAGNATISVKVGSDSYTYNVEVLTTSIENRIRNETVGNITSPFQYTFFDMVKVFGATFAGLLAANVVAWIIMRDKLLQEVQEIL